MFADLGKALHKIGMNAIAGWVGKAERGFCALCGHLVGRVFFLAYFALEDAVRFDFAVETDQFAVAWILNRRVIFSGIVGVLKGSVNVSVAL